MMLWTFIAAAKMCSKARHLLCNPTIQALWKTDMEQVSLRNDVEVTHTASSVDPDSLERSPLSKCVPCSITLKTKKGDGDTYIR